MQYVRRTYIKAQDMDTTSIHLHSAGWERNPVLYFLLSSHWYITKLNFKKMGPV